MNLQKKFMNLVKKPEIYFGMEYTQPKVFRHYVSNGIRVAYDR